MFEPKPITAGGVPGALQKAERYRLLNDPQAAESICLDILAVEPENQVALVMLLLARTDQLATTMAAGAARAREVLPRLRDGYKRAYYGGVIQERHAKALLHSGRPGSSAMAYDAFRDAMEHYEPAVSPARAAKEEARLRWNTGARRAKETPPRGPGAEENLEPMLGE